MGERVARALGGAADAVRPEASRPSGVRAILLLAALFAALGLALYGPALRGPFLSDDVGVVLTNPHVHGLGAENLRAILDPGGEPALYTANYAPLHLLAHALEWQAFGSAPLGYHVVNVLLHALASALLVALFVARGIPRAAAIAGGAAFLLHPANVEAVAWIFQLKTVLALALATGALLAHARRPLLGTLLFGLALLTKASALAALPAAAVFAWTARGPQDGYRRHAPWLLAWAALLALYALPQLFAFERHGWAEPLHPDPLVTLRSLFAIGARYLAMAAATAGLSAFHEPGPARSWLDPWWLAGLAAAVAIGARALVALRRRAPEAGWWAFAAAGYAPVSQVFPFPYPMADRYLYFVLPGLLGAALELGRALAPRARAALARLGPAAPTYARRAGLVAAALLLALYGARTLERAPVWRSSTSLAVDAALHYPDGIAAHRLRAQGAARRGDARAAADALRAATERGYDRFMDVETSPVWAPVRDSPAFLAARRALARQWLERNRAAGAPAPADLRARAQAHLVLGDLEAAAEALRRALRQGGSREAALRRELAAVEARLEAQPEAAPEGGTDG